MDIIIKQLKAAQHVVVFTGAGISAESGIATFRDRLTGLWERFNAEELATASAFRRNPELVWGWYEWRRFQVRMAQPNAAHLAIAKLAQHVPKLTVVTQNVDDLHERAGSVGTLHLHGRLEVPRCFACNRPYTLPQDMLAEPANGRLLEPPRCTHCGGRIRPGVVWFGEQLPVQAWQEAMKAATSCQVLLAIGTSGVVYPAAGLPSFALDHGATVIHINPAAPTISHEREFSLPGKAADSLPKLIKQAFG